MGDSGGVRERGFGDREGRAFQLGYKVVQTKYRMASEI